MGNVSARGGIDGQRKKGAATATEKTLVTGLQNAGFRMAEEMHILRIRRMGD